MAHTEVLPQFSHEFHLPLFFCFCWLVVVWLDFCLFVSYMKVYNLRLSPQLKELPGNPKLLLFHSRQAPFHMFSGEIPERQATPGAVGLPSMFLREENCLTTCRALLVCCAFNISFQVLHLLRNIQHPPHLTGKPGSYKAKHFISHNARKWWRQISNPGLATSL